MVGCCQISLFLSACCPSLSDRKKKKITCFATSVSSKCFMLKLYSFNQRPIGKSIQANTIKCALLRKNAGEPCYSQLWYFFAFSPQHEYQAAAVSACFSIPASLARNHKKQPYKVISFLQAPMLVMSVFNSSQLETTARSFSKPKLNSFCLNLSPLQFVLFPRDWKEQLNPFLPCSSPFLRLTAILPTAFSLPCFRTNQLHSPYTFSCIFLTLYNHRRQLYKDLMLNFTCWGVLIHCSVTNVQKIFFSPPPIYGPQPYSLHPSLTKCHQASAVTGAKPCCKAKTLVGHQQYHSDATTTSSHTAGITGAYMWPYVARNAP